MNKKMYALTSAAVAVASTVMIVDYVVRKKTERAAYAGILLAGIAGLIGGAVIAYQPEKKARRGLTVEDMLDDYDVAMVENNISEVLGIAADRGASH